MEANQKQYWQSLVVQRRKTQPKTAFEALKDFYRIGSFFTFTLFGRVVKGRVHCFDGECLTFCVIDTGKGLLVTMKWQDYKDLKKLPK